MVRKWEVLLRSCDCMPGVFVNVCPCTNSELGMRIVPGAMGRLMSLDNGLYQHQMRRR